MGTGIDFGIIIYIIITLILLKGTIYMVKQQTAVVIERLGKFHKVSRPGLQFKIPLIDSIAIAVKNELSETMQQFGFDFIKALVTDIDPDSKVKHAMNEINAAKRMKEAAKEEAAAAKIRVIAAAEADAESKRLAGEGIALQRIAIANGLKESVAEVKLAMEDHVTSQDVMNMLFMTQHYETVAKLSENNTSTIFMPYSPDNVGDLQMQIQSSLLAVDKMKKKEKV